MADWIGVDVNHLTCEQCGGGIPARSRATRRFCSKLCANRSYVARNAEAIRAAAPAYTARYLARQHAKLRASRASRVGRLCEWCDKPLPLEANARRKFCDRYCINQNSLATRQDARRESIQKRRSRLATDSRGVSSRDWRRLVSRYEGRCAYCGTAGRLTVDHIVPVSRGGRHAIGNVLPACFSCNSSKRDDLLIYWLNGRAKARLAA